jgi:hypothetical protein
LVRNQYRPPDSALKIRTALKSIKNKWFAEKSANLFFYRLSGRCDRSSCVDPTDPFPLADTWQDAVDDRPIKSGGDANRMALNQDT